MKTETIESIKEHAIDQLKDGAGLAVYGCDLHNELFNMDYFIIGYYQAEQWLITNVGIFNAIEEIKEYETFNFGEVNTDLSSSESVVNMYAYIKGEELLCQSDTLRECWDNRLDQETIDLIINELEEL